MRMETERLVLRGYQAGDGPGYYRMSQQNQPHLARYESGNAVISIHNEEEAEIAVRDFAADWVSRRAFFLGRVCQSHPGIHGADIYRSRHLGFTRV